MIDSTLSIMLYQDVFETRMTKSAVPRIDAHKSPARQL